MQFLRLLLLRQDDAVRSLRYSEHGRCEAEHAHLAGLLIGLPGISDVCLGVECFERKERLSERKLRRGTRRRILSIAVGLRISP